MKIRAFLALLFSSCLPLSAQDVPNSVTNVSATEAQALLAKKEAGKTPAVIDIRTPDEFKEGHIEGAKNIDFRSPTFAADVAKLDKTKPYIVHCAAGSRSTKSLEIFKKEGFKTILHLNGGFNEWSKQGLPAAKGQ